MITFRDRRTPDLFDRWSEMGQKRRLLLDRSWAGVFRDHLLDDLPIQELLPLFDDRLGRPSKDLHIVIGVLLLQQLHDLSDAATGYLDFCSFSAPQLGATGLKLAGDR